MVVGLFAAETFVYEGGLLAGWALRSGGLGWLLLVDALAVFGLIAAAVALRLLVSGRGFKGCGRAVFVLLQLPYALVTSAVVINNVVLTFLG